MIGRVLTRYKLLEEVGHGGMAVVYKGLDTALGREVAVKVLHPHLAGLSESRARLEREAQAVAKLRHENILEIFDYSGPDSKDSFIVTELVHGPSLTAFLRDHPRTDPPCPEVAEMIVSEVARALEHAHKAGVIHRDVKPDNVLITDDGLIKLADFGIAQIVDKERMTVTGQLLGSPAYMSPEHVEGGRLDFRTDVFACGILLYQLATGELPFRGKNPHEVLKRIAECRFVPADQANPRVGAQLARIVARALARKPEDRHGDVGALRAELVEDLRACGVDDPRAELRAYFRDPGTWEPAFKPRLVAALARAGREAVARGKRAAALALWGRALATAPDDAEVRALIEGLAGRRRLARLSIGGAVALLAVGGGYGAWHLSSGRPAHVDPPPVTAPVHVGNDRPVPTAPTRPTRVAVAPTAHPRPVVEHRLQLARRDEARLVTVETYPKAVEILVDGKPGGRSDQAISVSPGAHELTLRDRCCADATVRLPDGATRVALTKLEWRNGTLDVPTTPPGAHILYRFDDDTEPKIADGAISVRFPKEGDGQRVVHLSVSAPQHRTVDKDCTARAGETVRCAVDLPRAQ